MAQRARRANAQARILQAISESGAPSTTTQLARALKLPHSTILRQTAILERLGVLASARMGRERILRLARRDLVPEALASAPAQRVLARGTASSIAAIVLREPGIAMAEMLQRAQIQPRQTYYHVRRLRLAGLIEPTDAERNARLWPTPLLAFLAPAFVA